MTEPAKDSTPQRTATVGMFDGVHRGHRHLIDFAHSHTPNGAPLVVTFPDHPLSVINPQRAPLLLTSPAEKESLLRQAGANPLLLNFDDNLRRLTSDRFIMMLNSVYGINRLVIGFNNRLGSDLHTHPSEYADIARRHGVEIITAPELSALDTPINSTTIRTLLSEGKITEATRLLGHPYTISGTVGHGRQLGRTIGFPTANITPDYDRKLLPAHGVYAAMCRLDNGDTYRAILNIGSRPSVDNIPNVTIEAHIDGFDGNLYGRPLTLTPMVRLRDTRPFPSLHHLARQLQADLDDARRLLP